MSAETPRERQIREALAAGAIAVTVPDTGERVGALPFKLGDRVQKKAAHRPPNVERIYWTGTVAYLPTAGAPVLQLGGHTLGREIGVDLRGGGRAIGDPDEWERYCSECGRAHAVGADGLCEPCREHGTDD